MKIIKADPKDEAGCVDLELDEPSHDPDIFWMQQRGLGISLDKKQVKEIILELQHFINK